MSEKAVVTEHSCGHSGVMVSLQILAMERGSVLSKVHQELRTHTLEVE